MKIRHVLCLPASEETIRTQTMVRRVPGKLLPSRLVSLMQLDPGCGQQPSRSARRTRAPHQVAHLLLTSLPRLPPALPAEMRALHGAAKSTAVVERAQPQGRVPPVPPPAARGTQSHGSPVSHLAVSSHYAPLLTYHYFVPDKWFTRFSPPAPSLITPLIHSRAAL